MLSASGTYVLLTCFQFIILLVNFASLAAELNHKPFSNGKPGLGCCRVEEGTYLLARLPFPPLSHRQSVPLVPRLLPFFMAILFLAVFGWSLGTLVARWNERRRRTHNSRETLVSGLSQCVCLSLSLSPAGTQLNSWREMPPVELERS